MDEIVVDVVSDVVCPWCYLGKARLEKAIEMVKDDLNVHVTWRPYQLNPDIPKEGVDHHAYLAAKSLNITHFRDLVNCLKTVDNLKEFGFLTRIEGKTEEEK